MITIEEISNSNNVTTRKFNNVAWMVELCDGLKKEHILKMADLLAEGIEVIPFEFSANNSTAIGFASIENIDTEEALKYVEDTLTPVLEDWNKETSDRIYKLPNGDEIFMGCDCDTINS